ncbi:hypothetical protein B0H14DRAFT_3524859 [Mycena olivaceomarginata]|nr:hypothetical protein B0H14DRAFT_3524859 [Mycena olivaceomarginata]
MDEGVVDDLDFGTTVQMEAEEPKYQFKYAGPRYEGNPVSATKYEEPMNELEYAGLIHEPDSFSVPMEYPPNLNAGPVDFPSEILVNPIESAAGLDNLNMEDIFPNFDPQVFDFGSTYNLPPLPAPPASSPPAPVVTEGMQSTRKCKTREPEVDKKAPNNESINKLEARLADMKKAAASQSEKRPRRRPKGSKNKT